MSAAASAIKTNGTTDLVVYEDSNFPANQSGAVTLTSSGTLATGTVTSTGGLTTGMTINITNAIVPQYNGHVMITVVNSTTFTYTLQNQSHDLSSSSGIYNAGVRGGHEIGVVLHTLDGSGNPQPVSTTNPLSSSNSNQTLQGNFTRPNNTTAYLAAQIVGPSTVTPTLLQLTGAATSNGRGGELNYFRLTTNLSSLAVMFRLWFFTINNPTVNADGGAFNVLLANETVTIGQVLLATTGIEGGGSDSAYAEDKATRLDYTCAANDTAIYLLVENFQGWTPAALQQFNFTIRTGLK